MRYTGSKWKINRRENYTVLGSSEKWKRRQSLPGQFPVLKKRPTDYAIQFREKQKVKRLYGLTEKQMKRFYEIALKSPNTSTRLLQLLELRIDNVLYKLGLSQTRAQARQMITHGHILLNGKKHNIPSTILKPEDEIKVKKSMSESATYKEVESFNKAYNPPSWLLRLEDGGKVVSEPLREDIDKSIKENYIVELYSR